ncbi:MAG: outer membrane beta-barrel protein [Bacteroidia bacterium]|nr:outer membrane beta-barrel protein [Bacteroidia bacterium]
MEDKKNIDRLFQEKFKDYEVFPEPIVWKNIEKQIRNQKKRRIIPLWLRFAGAAAILLILVSTGLWIFDQDNNLENIPNEIIITNTDIDTSTDSEKNDLDNDQKIINNDQISDFKEENLISTSNQQNYKSKSNKVQISEGLNSEVEENNTFAAEAEGVIANTEPVTEQSFALEEISNEDVILEEDKALVALEENNEVKEDGKTDLLEELNKLNDNEEIAEAKTKKWSVGSIIAPVYYNTFSNGSPIAPSLANNNKDGEGSVSYGLKLNYKLSNKFSLQSGINTVELGYVTENVSALLSSSLLDGSDTNINTNVDDVSVATVSTLSQNSETFSQRSSIDQNGSLDQNFSYVEIPLEAKYNILQKKLGVNIVGGISTYLLYQNKVTINSFGKSTILGEASNLNSLNFSGNLGLDFDYNISKKLYINVSPMLKYQFNTFSENAGGFQPYYFGVYTGLNFRF